MPRPREFDVTEVLDRATRLFWTRGYGGTSLNELEKVMGIGRTSIYAAFGGKEALFLRVIDHYEATHGARLRTALKSGGGVKAAIERYFAVLLATFADPDLPLGCLVTNVAVAGDRGTSRVGRKIARLLTRLEDIFYEVLRDGQATGEVGLDVDTRSLARYFVAATHGLSTLAKGLPDRTAVADVAGVILSDLDSRLRPGAGAPAIQSRTHNEDVPARPVGSEVRRPARSASG